MPKYISQAYLTKNGKVFPTGQEIELTEEQAERLGKKVEKAEGSDQVKKSADADGSGQTDISKLTSAELDELALKELEIPEDEYPKSGNKAAKIEAIQVFQEQQASGE